MRCKCESTSTLVVEPASVNRTKNSQVGGCQVAIRLLQRLLTVARFSYKQLLTLLHNSEVSSCNLFQSFQGLTFSPFFTSLLPILFRLYRNSLLFLLFLLLFYVEFLKSLHPSMKIRLPLTGLSLITLDIQSKQMEQEMEQK